PVLPSKLYRPFYFTLIDSIKGVTKMKKLPLFLRIALQTAANNSKINSKYVLAFAAFGALLIAGYGKRCLVML
ncbi:MAG: hypothetical protein WAY39_10805, partial [Gemmiger qucibialis]